MAATVTFSGPELLGCPTNESVTVNVVADTALDAYFEYGTISGTYTANTSTVSSAANEPIEVVIDGLDPDTRYYYRMVYSENSGSTWNYRDEHSFHTQRPKGSTFNFTIISDSHAYYNTQYEQTMENVLDDNPDFHFDLGDTFMTDSDTSQAQVDAEYLAQRDKLYMGKISSSVPIFLASGNHENEEGWNLDDTPFSIGVASVQARKMYFPTPNPNDGSFYSTCTDPLAAINEITYGDEYRENYYAWEWGDALFVVLDPFQYTMGNPYGSSAGEGSDDPATNDAWNWTLGIEQYLWFKNILENSDAKYKFIFAHHVVGGMPSYYYVRGGAEAVPYYEWGGYSWSNSWEFDTERPSSEGWDEPVHQLMVENNVSAFFHGHDHQYAYEVRDGIVYQCLPRPTSGMDFNYYSESDPYTIKVLSSPGHLRLTVTPTETTVDYISTSGASVAYSYTIEPSVVEPAEECSYVGDIGTASSQTTGTSLVITTTEAVTEGDDIIVAFATYGDPDYEISITDDAGNTYEQTAMSINYEHGRTYLFASYNVDALPSGSEITITHTSVEARATVASVFSGLADTDALDQSLANPVNDTLDASTTPSVGPVTTTQANELLIGAIGTEGPVSDDAGTWLNSFTEGPRDGTDGASTDWTISMGHRIVSDIGDYTAAKTGITSARWASVISTFKCGASGPVPDYVFVDGATSSNTTDDESIIIIPHTTGTGENRLMLVGISWNCGSNDRSISSVTFTPDGDSAIPLDPVITQQAESQLRYSAIYFLLGPPSGTLGTVTVTFSGSVSNGIVAGVANFAGVDQTTPLGTPDGAGSGTNDDAPSVTLTGLNGNELVFDNVFQGASGESQTLTAGSGQTELWNSWIANTRAAASTEQATGSSVTMSWTAASASYWAIAAVPINPAEGEPTPSYSLDIAVDPVAGGTTTPSVGSHTYTEGSVVDISATPASGYEFDYWSGDCSGSGDCVVTMDDDKDVTAHFTETAPGVCSYVGDIGSAKSTTNGGSLVIDVDTNVAVGDTVIVAVASRGNPNLDYTVTDSAGNTYSEAVQSVSYTHGRAYIFYGYVNNALDSDDTITVSNTPDVAGRAAVASIFSGVVENGLDQALGFPLSSGEQTSSDNPSVGPVTTTYAGELLVGAIGTEGPVGDDAGTWENSFIAGPRDGTTGATYEWTISMGYRIVSSVGDYIAEKSDITEQYWAATIATFECEAAGECTIDDDCGFCEKCESNTCVPQTDSEDLKDECAAGDCASGFCDGVGSCDIEPVTTVCRASAGVCDLEDYCDGTNVACPSDLKSTSLCRASEGECDVAEYCNGVDNDCPADAKAPFGTSCDDGLWCSETDHCDGSGDCVQETPRDCSGLDDQCNVGVCNEDNDQCEADSTPFEGNSCDDGLFCNIGETCQSGICTGGGTRDCSHLDDECNIGECSEGLGTCYADPVADGMSCGDSTDSDCDNPDICSAGSCVNNYEPLGTDCGICAACDGSGSCVYDETQDNDCDAYDQACSGTCFASPDDIDATWDTADSIDSECSALFTCSNTAATCNYYSHECSVSTCGAECDATHQCADTECDGNDGCVDDDYYDYDDVPNSCLGNCICETNACGAPTISYSDPRCTECQDDEDCNYLDVDYCDGDLVKHDEGKCVDYECTAETTTLYDCNDDNSDYCDGTEIKHEDYTCLAASCSLDLTTLIEDCDDGLYCNGAETCDAAICYAGTPVSCSHLDDDCNEGVCDDNLDDCIVQPKLDGTSCDDGLFCTENDECTSGVCGGSTKDCSDSVSCTVDSCNENTDMCENIPDDIFCDDGLWCNGAETCHATLDCQAGTDVDCSDDLYCTVNEGCDEAQDKCVYDNRDCSANNIGGIATCFNVPDDDNPFTWDYRAAFTSVCDEDANECTTGDDTITHSCDYDQCSAECDAIHECEDSQCSETYDDYCTDKKLTEYDSDKVMDSTIVIDSCTNSCLIDCICTDCSVDCSAPSTNTYCVKDVCDAECDSDDDCLSTDCDYLDGCVEQDYYDYSDVENTCSGDCSCTSNSCGSPTISYNDPRCNVCGNGVIDPGEECEPGQQGDRCMPEGTSSYLCINTTSYQTPEFDSCTETCVWDNCETKIIIENDPRCPIVLPKPKCSWCSSTIYNPFNLSKSITSVTTTTYTPSTTTTTVTVPTFTIPLFNFSSLFGR